MPALTAGAPHDASAYNKYSAATAYKSRFHGKPAPRYVPGTPSALALRGPPTPTGPTTPVSTYAIYSPDPAGNDPTSWDSQGVEMSDIVLDIFTK